MPDHARQKINMAALTLVFVAMWFGVGATCGFLVRYGRDAQKKGPPYLRAWAMYLIGMLVCFALLEGIYELCRSQLLGDRYDWVGMVVMTVSFFGAILKKSNRRG